MRTERIPQAKSSADVTFVPAKGGLLDRAYGPLADKSDQTGPEMATPTGGPRVAGPTGASPSAGFDLSQIPTSGHPMPALQPSTRVSQPNDPLEREADAAADRVVSGLGAGPVTQDPTLTRTAQAKTDNSGGGTFREETDEPRFVDLQDPEEDLEPTGPVQAKARPGASPATAARPANGLGGPGGRSLPEPLRGRMEQGFSADFSNVRVHTGQEADQVCKSFGARALTSGNHIHMASGEYRPETQAGQHLLAHELAHTVQQGAAPTTATSDQPVIQSPGQSPDDVQRTIDLSIQFDSYSLSALSGAVPYSGGDVGAVLREMETTALGHFSARNPVTAMSVSDTWYYYNPMFTRSVYASRSAATALISNYYWYATDRHDFNFRYAHTATRPRTGSFASSNGNSRSRTTTLTAGAKLTYSIIELSASASSATTTGSSSSTTATSTNYYEHDYNVSLNYSSSYYEMSDFRLRNTFWGPRIDRVGGPHSISGTVPVGTCSVKDDDSNPDNLTP